MAEASFSFTLSLSLPEKRTKSIALSRWGAITAGTFAAGLIGRPFVNQLDNAEGAIPALLTVMIAMSLLIPPVVLIFTVYLGSKWFIRESWVAIERAARSPVNTSSRRTVRFIEMLVSGGRVTRDAAQVGGAGLAAVGGMAAYLVALLLALVVFLFVVGGIIGLLVIGWNAL